METAQKASTALTAPAPPKKAYVRPVGSVKPSEIRKTRWKRFKYEMGLKMKSHGNGKGKDRKKFKQMKDTNDVELEEMRGEARVTERATERATEGATETPAAKSAAKSADMA